MKKQILSSRPFHLAISTYEDGAPATLGEDFRFSRHGRHKWPAVWENMVQAPWIFGRYQNVMFLDDDVEIGWRDIENLFTNASLHQAHLYQPALTPQSQSAHGCTKYSGMEGFRQTGFVEIMTPVFSRLALAVCWHSFNFSESGWGLDLLWPKILHDELRGHEKIGVDDGVLATHTSGVTSAGWELSNGLTPFQEIKAAQQKYWEWRGRSCL